MAGYVITSQLTEYTTYSTKNGVRLTGKGIDAKNEEHYYVNGLLAQGVYEYDGAKRLFVNGDVINGWHFHQQPVDGKYYLFYENGVRLTGIGTVEMESIYS